MIFKLTNFTTYKQALMALENYFGCGYTIEINVFASKISRSQQKALHLFFKWVANAHNELGLNYHTQIGGLEYECRWNPDLVKEALWRPIQIALFKVESTTRIDTHQINEIVDVLRLFFAEKGIIIDFPNWQSYLNSLDCKNYIED